MALGLSVSTMGTAVHDEGNDCIQPGGEQGAVPTTHPQDFRQLGNDRFPSKIAQGPSNVAEFDGPCAIDFWTPPNQILLEFAPILAKQC